MPSNSTLAEEVLADLPHASDNIARLHRGQLATTIEQSICAKVKVLRGQRPERLTAARALR